MTKSRYSFLISVNFQTNGSKNNIWNTFCIANNNNNNYLCTVYINNVNNNNDTIGDFIATGKEKIPF